MTTIDLNQVSKGSDSRIVGRISYETVKLTIIQKRVNLVSLEYFW